MDVKSGRYEDGARVACEPWRFPTAQEIACLVSTEPSQEIGRSVSVVTLMLGNRKPGLPGRIRHMATHHASYRSNADLAEKATSLMGMCVLRVKTDDMVAA